MTQQTWLRYEDRFMRGYNPPEEIDYLFKTDNEECQLAWQQEYEYMMGVPARLMRGDRTQRNAKP